MHVMSRRCYFVDWSNDDAAGRAGWAGGLGTAVMRRTNDGQPRKKSTIVKGHLGQDKWKCCIVWSVQ